MTRTSHTARGVGRLGLVLGVVAVMVGAGCTGPPPARGLFQDPVAIAATPDGTIWVVDAGSAEVIALRDGIVVRRIGGSGTGDDAFIDPVDVDPTNGHTIFVADRAAGTIVRVTAEGRVAQSIPVPDVDPAQPIRQSSRREARGQPTAVAVAPDGGLYVIDAGRRHVLRLDAEGAVERVLGAGILSDPVDLAVDDEGTVWVADVGRGVVQSFDAFGSAGRTVGEFRESRIVGISVSGHRLGIVQARATAFADGDDLVLRDRQPGEPDLRAAVLLAPLRWVLLTADGVERPGGAVGD